MAMNAALEVQFIARLLAGGGRVGRLPVPADLRLQLE
jgi:hypothetical protein